MPVRSVSMRRVRSMQNLREGGAGSPTPSAGHTGARLPVLSERELREHFNRPLNEVAKKYGMCTTALKKLCRRCAPRSPCRFPGPAQVLLTSAPHSYTYPDTVPSACRPVISK